MQTIVFSDNFSKEMPKNQLKNMHNDELAVSSNCYEK